MKILHIAAYNNLYFNGVYAVLSELTKEQMKLGHQVRLLNIDNNEGRTLPIEQKTGTQQDFRKLLEDYNPDITILHGIYKWCYIGYIRTLDHLGIPYLVEPHGGTSKANARKNPLKKLIGRLLIGNRLISHAKAVIYLNQHEADNCIYSRRRQQYVIIPNGINKQPQKPMTAVHYPIKFIFLARIDIVDKALDILFPAIKRFNTNPNNKEKAEFHFYGKARMPQYITVFNQYIKEADDNVFYHGPAFGQEKVNAFHSSDIFILTSRSEGMPISVLEALACGLPCLLTPQTNMADTIERYHCGWVTPLTVEAIAEHIRQVVREYPSIAGELSENARNAVKELSWTHIAQKSLSCYEKYI